MQLQNSTYPYSTSYSTKGHQLTKLVRTIVDESDPSRIKQFYRDLSANQVNDNGKLSWDDSGHSLTLHITPIAHGVRFRQKIALTLLSKSRFVVLS